MTTDPGRSRLASVGRSALILTAGSAVIQVVGIVRELFIAANVGISAELDQLLVALFLPTTLATVVTSGIVRAIVPAYLEAATNTGADAARRLGGTVVIWMGIAGLALSVVLFVLAAPIAVVAGPGLSPAGQAQTAEYLRLLAPVAFVTTVTNVLGAIFQAQERFTTIAVTFLATPVVTLIVMLAMWSTLGLHGLAIGSLIGPIATFALVGYAAVRGRSAALSMPRNDERTRLMVRHAVPLTVAAALLQINVVGDRAIASLLGVGAVSALRYADVLVRVPFGAIGPAWGQAIYPTLVNSSLGSIRESLAEASELAIRYVIAVFTPVAVLTAAVAPLAVTIAYGRGAFTPADTGLTAQGVAGFAPLLVTFMLVPILTGAHNARRRGQLLLVGATLNVTINIGLDILLGRTLGVPGIALASSFAEGTVALVFLYRLAHSQDGFSLVPLGRTLALSVAASLPVAVVAAGLCWTGNFPSELLASIPLLVAFGLVGIAGYIVVSMRIGLPEPGVLVNIVMSRFRRSQPVPEP